MAIELNDFTEYDAFRLLKCIYEAGEMSYSLDIADLSHTECYTR
jgi:hypothetical protein